LSVHDLLTTVSRAALAAGLVAAVATAAMPSARAQEPAPERGEVVFDRDRPDFDAKGLPLDGFRLFPAIEVVGAYDDNVFATDTNEQEDFLTIISPMIDLESQWSRHELNLAAYADIERYADNDSEDAEEYGIGFDGRLDVTARDEIRADARYDRRVEGRTDPDQGGGDRNEVDDIFFGLGYTHEFNRISVAFDASYRDLDFIGDALRLRDRVVYEAQARVTYDVSPRFDVFVEPFYIYREYDVSRTPAGIEQDFETFGLLGGTTIDLTGVLVGEIGLGVFQDEFEEPTRDSVTGFALEIELDWNVTELTSIRARASNESEATTVGGASNLVTTLAGLEVQHELMRNVLIGADAYVQREDFDGISRTDDTYGAGLEVQYLVNRYFSVFAEYDHETQESDVAAADYAINVVMVGIRGQF
jgi:hypothetical protein